MKRILAVSLALNVILFAAVGFLWHGLPTHADRPAPQGTPCGNGDVNADGDVDISDAVYNPELASLRWPGYRADRFAAVRLMLPPVPSLRFVLPDAPGL